MELDDPEGFYALFESLLLEMMKMGILIPRVDPELHEGRENYAVYYLLLIFLTSVVSRKFSYTFFLILFIICNLFTIN